jgi:hypothetical protein
MTKIETPDTTLEVHLTTKMKDQLTKVARDLDITIGQLMRIASQKILDDYIQENSDANGNDKPDCNFSDNEINKKSIIDQEEDLDDEGCVFPF